MGTNTALDGWQPASGGACYAFYCLVVPVSAGVQGDPHIHGGDGDLADLRGRNNSWYNFLSTRNMSVAVHFIHDNFFWRRKFVYGSWMKAVAITAASEQGFTVKVLYKVEQATAYTYQISGKTLEGHEGEAISLKGIRMQLTADHTFSFSNGAWEIEAKNRFLPYKHKNGNKRRLDFAVKPIGDNKHELVSPHGIVGQTFDYDDKMVLGKVDDYDIPSHVIVTRAMAEGAIEGSAVDYEVDPTNPFSTDFKFSRFGLTGRVAPRNISVLSGVVLPVKGKTGAAVAAGILNDDPDAS
jgi:hypothetical protein